MAILGLLASAVALVAADEDTLSLEPVATAKIASATPQALSTTAADADSDSASAQSVSPSHPKMVACGPLKDGTHTAPSASGSPTQFLGVDVVQTRFGQRILVKASGPIAGLATPLSSPDRILVKLRGVGFAAKGLSKVRALNKGVLERVRFAVKNSNEIWVVFDLSAKVFFKSAKPNRDTFELILGRGKGAPLAAQATASSAATAPAPAAPPNVPASVPATAAAPAHAPVPAAASAPSHAPQNVAALPRINLMLFDLDVIYQGKQYKRFPCANFIYNVGDRFPLKRDFVSTLVFSHGFGAFVGNARILDPQGHMLAQTETPFAFNLFNTLTEFMVELPWKVEFSEKGFYTLWVDLNGSDALKQTFYVGQTTDAPPAE